jgi:small-conductance mechanosensitive channel
MVSNDLVIVPNATIAKSRIINFTSADEQHGVIVPLSVAYGSELDHVERVVREVAADIQTHAEGAVRDHEPPVRFTEFADSSVPIIAVLRVEQYSERFAVRHEFLKLIYTRFAEENIEIPFPQRTVHLAEALADSDD